MKRLLATALLVAGSCADPVHSDQVDAIPDDGKPDGPTHHVGEWCTACHGRGAIGDPPQFSAAGTIFDEMGNALAGAQVIITDGNGTTRAPLYTNEVGNFYIEKDAYDPVYPLSVEIVSPQGLRERMLTRIGRDGGCGRCHHGPGDRSHTRYVYVPTKVPDGGT